MLIMPIFSALLPLHRRFNLIEPKETDVLRDLEIALRLTDDPAFPQQQQPSSLSSCESSSQTTLLQSSLSTITSLSMSSSSASTAAASQNLISSGSVSLSGTLYLASSKCGEEHTTSIFDGDASTQPICQQPEVGVQRSTTTQDSTLQTISGTTNASFSSQSSSFGVDSRGDLAHGNNNTNTTNSQSTTHSAA